MDQIKTSSTVLNYQEASNHLGIKQSTLYSLVSQGRIPCIKYGNRFVRFRLSDLNKWTEDHIALPKQSRKRSSR